MSGRMTLNDLPPRYQEQARQQLSAKAGATTSAAPSKVGGGAASGGPQYKSKCCGAAVRIEGGEDDGNLGGTRYFVCEKCGNSTDVLPNPFARRERGRTPNKTESAFRVWMSARAGAGDGLDYESLTFRLPGGSRYTPDFVRWRLDGRLECFEVKGSYRLGSHGRALTAFREVRAAFPAVRFRWFKKTDGGEFMEEYAE